MLIVDIMTTPVESISPDAPLEDAIDTLARARVSSLPVIDHDLRVVGIITEGDVLRQRLPADPRAHLRPTESPPALDQLVSDVMSADPRCATDHQDSSEVALTLSRRGWKSMPVVDERGRLLGMVSRSDFVRALSLPDATLSDAVVRAFAQAGHPEWHATVHHGHVIVSPAPNDLTGAALATARTVAGVRSVALAQEG